ncbi:MAG: response regulator [Alphaproteobacteria bacterium]|jgi:DNA-binding response OmpR family regulator|nr:response regulator [Alphaproteobacteria bacterium]
MTGSTRILVVDDDPRVRRLLDRYLTREGFEVVEAADGSEMRRALDEDRISLVLLDLVLPGEDGLTLARDLRQHSDLPIIILSGKGKMLDRVIGLEVGADDYIVKPFHLREVLARIRSVLRRRREDQPVVEAEPTALAGDDGQIFDFAGWRLDAAKRELAAADRGTVALTTGEFNLLLTLVKSAGRVLNRDQLMDQVAGRAWSPYDRTMDCQVRRLRAKIERNPSKPELIKTVRGVGYVFTPKVTQA